MQCAVCSGCHRGFDCTVSFHFVQFASEDDMVAMSAPGVRLITAASDGDKKGVRRWLDQGVDVDSRDWDNLTPLIAASSQGHLVRGKYDTARMEDE